MKPSPDTGFLAAAAILGLLGGFLLGVTSHDTGSGYCGRIESGVASNQSFRGTINCRPPGVYDVKISNSVENRTELRCVCRKAYQGREEYFTVNVVQAR